MYKTATINGKRICYTSNTVFLVQVSKSKNRKSGYENKYSFVGDLERACVHYQGINVGLGYKKRLIFCGSQKPVLLRQTS